MIKLLIENHILLEHNMKEPITIKYNIVIYHKPSADRHELTLNTKLSIIHHIINI